MVSAMREGCDGVSCSEGLWCNTSLLFRCTLLYKGILDFLDLHSHFGKRGGNSQLKYTLMLFLKELGNERKAGITFLITFLSFWLE